MLEYAILYNNLKNDYSVLVHPLASSIFLSYPLASSKILYCPLLSSCFLSSIWPRHKCKKTLQAYYLQGLLSSDKNGGYLLSHGCAVPSARTGLTSLFGMGRGGTPTL